MSNHVFIVNRLHPGLYADLSERFAHDAEVTVILDRRLGARRRRSVPAAAERRRAERRSRPRVDEQLRTAAYAVVSAPSGGLPLQEARQWIEAVQGRVAAVRGALDEHDRLQREFEALQVHNERLRAEVDRSRRDLEEIDAGLARVIAVASDILSRLRGESGHQHGGR